MTNPNIAFFPIARTTFDLEFAKEVRSAVYQHLLQLPATILAPVELITNIQAANEAAEQFSTNPPDLVIVLQTTFADSTMVMAVANKIDAPLLLWAVPEEHTGGRLRLNSLCGINLAGHALTRAKLNYSFLYTWPGDNHVSETIITLARAGFARNALRNARLGRIGENPDGFETCLVDRQRIQQLFGLELVQFNLEQTVFPKARQVDNNLLDEIQSGLAKKVSGLSELDPAPTRGTLSVYAALKELAAQEELKGFAVRCWPEFFTEMGCAACGAMSMLSDEGIPCSCEADVNGTITQLLLQSVSNQPAFGTDIVSVDAERDAIVIWHCGLAPISMANPDDPVGVTIHSNRALPLLFEFTLKPGLVTVARLSEASGSYRLVLGLAEVIAAPKSFSGTSGLIKFNRPAGEILEVILGEGLEHHISLTYGDHIDVLKAFAKMTGIQVVNLSR